MVGRCIQFVDHSLGIVSHGDMTVALAVYDKVVLTETVVAFSVAWFKDGLVTRTIYAEVPPRVEYSITDRTRSLLPHVNSLIAWAKENMPAILRDRESHGKRKK